MALITVAGNIATGKTTLTTLLAPRLGWEPDFEDVRNNLFFSDFYADMPRWALQSQLAFLARHLVVETGYLGGSPRETLQDRSLYEDAEIFARHLYNLGHLSEREWSLYRTFYTHTLATVYHPQIVVYLYTDTETLLRRVVRRARPGERAIAKSYLEELQFLYASWSRDFDECPIIRVDSTNLDALVATDALDSLANDLLRRVETQA